MKITLDSLGKQYRKDWIFRDLQYEFEPGGTYAILGPNGSGKSTLLQLINNSLTPTHGQVLYEHEGKTLEADEVYKYISFAAPYMELIEELNLTESLNFHAKFKNYRKGFNAVAIIGELGMGAYSSYLISEFSSGLKQRLKLALAFFSESELLILDEPATNLDAEGLQWFDYLAEQHRQSRTLIIGSNRPEEYKHCEREIKLGSAAL